MVKPEPAHRHLSEVVGDREVCCDCGADLGPSPTAEPPAPADATFFRYLDAAAEAIASAWLELDDLKALTPERASAGKKSLAQIVEGASLLSERMNP